MHNGIHQVDNGKLVCSSVFKLFLFEFMIISVVFKFIQNYLVIILVLITGHEHRRQLGPFQMIAPITTRMTSSC